MKKIKYYILISILLILLQNSAKAQTYNIEDSIQWKKLMDTTLWYFKKNEFPKAVPYAEKSFKLAKKTFSKNHFSYLMSLNALAVIYFKEKKYNLSEPLMLEGIECGKNFYSENSIQAGVEFSLLGLLYKEMNLPEKAEYYLKKGISIQRNNYKDPLYNKQAYNNNLFALGRFYYERSKFFESESCYTELINYIDTTSTTELETYVTVLNDLGSIYQNLGKYAEAKKALIQTVEINKRLYGINHSKYIITAINLATLYCTINDYRNAEHLIRKVLEQESFFDDEDKLNSFNLIAHLFYEQNKMDSAQKYFSIVLNFSKKVYGENSSEITAYLRNYGNLYVDLGLYSKADSIFKTIIELEKELPDDHKYHEQTLLHLVNFYDDINNFKEAEICIKKLLNIAQKRYGDNSILYAEKLKLLANLNFRRGDFTNADSLYNKSLSIFKKEESYTTLIVYYSLQIDYAGFLQQTGKLVEAEKIYTSLLSSNKSKLGEFNKLISAIYMNLGGLNLNLKNFVKAEYYYSEASRISESLYGTKHKDYASALNGLALVYDYEKKYELAESTHKKAASIYLELFGSNHLKYANLLNNLSITYINEGKFTDAEKALTEALAINYKLLGEKNDKVIANLNNLGNLYDEQNFFEKAEFHYLKSISIYEEIFNSLYSDNGYAYDNLLGLYFTHHKQLKWTSLIEKNLLRNSSEEKKLLQGFSESEKEVYLLNQSLVQQFYLSMLHYFKSESTNSFYKSTTAKQGWLLQSKQQLIQLANQSKDSSIRSLLTQWQNINRQYAQAIQLTTEKRQLNNFNLDSLQEQSQQLEKQLIVAMPALQAVITKTGFTGKEVASKLKPKEAVIHWVSFQYKSPKEWTDSVLYAAYIITPNDTAPKFVTVFEEKQLQQILKSYYASANARSTIKKDSSKNTNADIALYNLVWKPLLPYLQNATTVYNLPAGLLHKISFAALTDSSNKSLIDTYEIHQLLSINELVTPLKIDNKNNIIALFGGANYNVANTVTTVSGTITQAPMYRNATNNSTNIQFNYLQGTKTEVETVANNAKNTNWKTKSYIGTSATEDNLKSIGGESAPKILHIATHGFYFPPTKTKPSNFIHDDKNAPRDYPLLRSGFVLSGANNYWGKDTLVENQEDGIVTAQEISNLNLLNTDLVVLSACQTALGDINGSEGVYGLQRAFKMAGVKKLLMSLWEVPDAETAELMQLFYSNVFKGDTYYTAFRKAQLTLKAKYKDPTKWAGFVLVGE